MVIAHLLGHPLRMASSVLKLSCAAHLAFSLVMQVSAAGGPSMLPTLSVVGDWLLVDMTACRGRRIAVGDLVLYKIPAERAHCGVKRLVGMPGDYVCLGTPGPRGLGGDDPMIQVPQGHCWVVGDNLSASRDSRHFGPLPLALLQGKVVAKVLPWRERQWIGPGLQSMDNIQT